VRHASHSGRPRIGPAAGDGVPRRIYDTTLSTVDRLCVIGLQQEAHIQDARPIGRSRIQSPLGVMTVPSCAALQKSPARRPHSRHSPCRYRGASPTSPASSCWSSRRRRRREGRCDGAEQQLECGRVAPADAGDELGVGVRRRPGRGGGHCGETARSGGQRRKSTWSR
jgi:hypothetical protein